jgi:hypothetical protein
MVSGVADADARARQAVALPSLAGRQELPEQTGGTWLPMVRLLAPMRSDCVCALASRAM